MKSDKPSSGKDLADVPLMQVTHDHLLNEAVKVTQPVDGYRVGSDAVLLAASIGTTTGRVLDLGAGVGGVCLCLAQRLVELQVTAVEKNADMAALCNENATQNGLHNRIRVLTADIREMPPVLAGSFDHVFSNPGSLGCERFARGPPKYHYYDSTASFALPNALWAGRRRCEK